jgi:hypothetical protein
LPKELCELEKKVAFPFKEALQLLGQYMVPIQLKKIGQPAPADVY